MIVVGEIFLERETANDQCGTVVAVHVDSGKAVKLGQPLFDVEHSKATIEICATADGFLVHELVKGTSVTFGSKIANVVDSIEDLLSLVQPQPETSRHPNALPPAISAPASDTNLDKVAGLPRERPSLGEIKRHPKFSRAAAKLAEKHGLTSDDFAVDLVSEADVRKKIDADRMPAETGPYKLEAAGSKSLTRANIGLVERISLRKAEEIILLQSGAGNTTQSTLGIKIGKIGARRKASDTFDGKILDLVIFEASRLMKQFPNLNSAFAENQITKFSSINAGVAFDSGSKLIVYGIENSNLKGLNEIREEIDAALGRYLEDRLSLREMTNATFTVTDLSANRLDFILPILPAKQSCIIGITRNVKEEFAIYAGFDHRVTEGREVALFLDQLAERIISFDRGGATREPVRCYFCETPLKDEDRVNHDKKGLLKVVTARGNEVLCCTNCWDGW